MVFFYNALNYYYTVDIQSKYFYFLKPLSIEKKLGFQKGDPKFKNFTIKLILQEMKFEDGNFILLDETSGTIINALIAECVQNIRREMIQNTLDLDCNDLIRDINKLELEKNVGSFDFLVKSINLLRILKADMNDQYEGFNRTVKPDIHLTTINNIENNHLYDYSQQTEIAIDQEFIDIKHYNLTENNQLNENRKITNINTDNHFTDINNTYHLTTNNNTYPNPQNKKRNLPIIASEKKDSNQKLTIAFSPFKFKNLLIKFFENTGVKIDSEKKDRIDRFILNTIEFNKEKYGSFNGSPSEITINFFDNKKARILKFSALLIVLMNEVKIEAIPIETLQNILIAELVEINTKRIGISTDLRNQIHKKLDGLTNAELAQYAGFKNLQEMVGLIKS